MRRSQLFTKTSKNAPADETSKNAQLLIRAGYAYKVMAGVYAYTPLGLRVIENIKRIVREEMNAVSGQELIMTNLQPRDIWEQTGRWDDKVVDIWFKTKLKDGQEVGLAWSHEEAIIEMMKQSVVSYKDLPVSVYQFQNKLRNELRAKSGVMRGREFVMKDMYSMSVDAKQHDAYYDSVIEAYKKVFKRLGLDADTHVTYASGGAFTQFSHEFQTICEAGEDTIVQTGDGIWHNLEIAPAKLAEPNVQEKHLPYKERELKDVIGVAALLKALNIPIEKSTKTLAYTTDDGEVILAAVRSDYQINEVKLAAIVDTSRLMLASESEVRQATGAAPGYAGIMNVPAGIKVYCDDSLEGLTNFETGANKTNYHAVNVNFGRDVEQPEAFYDFKEARSGDLDPMSGKPLVFAKSAEVGNIFNFGTDKSEQMDFAFTDENGERRFVHLGSYGIGITRVMGVIAEKFADDKGLVWPDAVAPFRVYLAPLGDSPEVTAAADNLYDGLTEAGVPVLYDDRDARAGEKFADADLLGIPQRVVISDKTLAGGTFELKARTDAEARQVSESELRKALDISR
jgi:prolyl-tRNA synthetase